MCLVKTPTITPQASQEKPVQVFTNRYFVDRGVNAVATRTGRNSLRIDRSTASAPPVTMAPPTQVLTPGVQFDGGSGPQAPTIGYGGVGLSDNLRRLNLAIA